MLHIDVDICLGRGKIRDVLIIELHTCFLILVSSDISQMTSIKWMTEQKNIVEPQLLTVSLAKIYILKTFVDFSWFNCSYKQ